MAGCADMKHKLIAELDQRLAKLVLGTVDVRSSNEAGFTDAVRLSTPIRTKFRHNQDRLILTTFFKEIELDTNKAVWGVKETMKALSMDLVSEVIVAERCDVRRFVLRNTLNGITVTKYATESGAANPSFSVDSPDVKWEVLEDGLVLEWLKDNHATAQLQIVLDHTEEGARFASGGGVGCLLRYAVDLDDNDTE